MNRQLQSILVIGAALSYVPHEMFPNILNTNDPVPVKPKHSKASWNVSQVEGQRRDQAAKEKRERRANKLRKLNREA